MQDPYQWLIDNKISEVECLVPDMTGNARGKFLPANKFIRQSSQRLPEGILLQSVTGNWPDDYWEILGPTDGDMKLQPDMATLRSVPWANEATVQIIHDCHRMDGTPHPLSTRNVLKHVLSLFEERGWFPIVAPEVEFYLVQQQADPDYELQPPAGRSGRQESARQSYSIDAVNEFEPIMEEMYNFCDAQGLDVDTLIHETGAAQMEINFLHGNALNLADQVFTFKRTMREVALRHGVFATFMSKPMAAEPGSAMHIHQSVVDKHGRNIFSAEDGSETELFRWYLGGLQKYMPALISFFAPNVNSYRRFTPEMAAPISLQWGYDNRTTGLRVPYDDPEQRRVENRFAGADANPYLTIAATLAGGYLGMVNQLEPSPAYAGNAYDREIDLARSLEEALRYLEEEPELKKVFSEDFLNAYRVVKLDEYEEFNQVISSWERKFLLLNV